MRKIWFICVAFILLILSSYNVYALNTENKEYAKSIILNKNDSSYEWNEYFDYIIPEICMQNGYNIDKFSLYDLIDSHCNDENNEKWWWVYEISYEQLRKFSENPNLNVLNNFSNKKYGILDYDLRFYKKLFFWPYLNGRLSLEEPYDYYYRIEDYDEDTGGYVINKDYEMSDKFLLLNMDFFEFMKIDNLKKILKDNDKNTDIINYGVLEIDKCQNMIIWIETEKENCFLLYDFPIQFNFYYDKNILEKLNNYTFFKYR